MTDRKKKYNNLNFSHCHLSLARLAWPTLRLNPSLQGDKPANNQLNHDLSYLYVCLFVCLYVCLFVCLFVCCSGQANEWCNGWGGKWMSEWVSEWVRVKVHLFNNTVLKALTWTQNLKVMLKTLTSELVCVCIGSQLIGISASSPIYIICLLAFYKLEDDLTPKRVVL
jgi:hypothetical protein